MSTPTPKDDGFNAVVYMTYKGISYCLNAEPGSPGDVHGVVRALTMLAAVCSHTIQVTDAGGVDAYRELLARKNGGGQ